MSVSKISMALLALSSTGVNAALEPIIAKGQKLFYENGTQFFMKGIAYQEDELPGGRALPFETPFIDPLADVPQCRRDIPKLRELGVNTIRTYAINATADHSECMRMLDDAGIYVISDLSHPRLSINRDAGEWNLALYDRYTSVIDELAQYNNVIGFFAGNEVTNNASNTPASAYVKAAVRDMKAHIRERDYRWMGVGYANNDDTEIREDIAHYFNCGRAEDSVDFWGYNIYSWCGQSTMQRSGYDRQVEFFTDYGVPVFFAEYGCIDASSAQQRIWQETEILYDDEMTGVFSGGLVFKYQQDAAKFGVVEINRDGSATEFPSFDRLARAHANSRPRGVEMDSYNTDFTTPSECPAQSETWEASAILPPTPDRDLCECAAAASPCGPSGTLSDDDMAEIFNFICDASPVSCAGIHHNSTSGVYGAFSMCGQAHKLAHVLGAYYENTNQAFDSCDFDGRAETKSDTSESSCRDPLASAAEHNEAAATQTQGDPASITGGTGSGSGGSGSDDTDGESFGVSSISMTRMFAMGDLVVGLYLAVAGAAGAAMVML
ncbi:Glucanosyltransferase-domain-containing protein [Stachybotrys elegans]|uniref:1,3-beta-glucanosyltransferase n=1 Tax=Stachybotrys elegans TaxID=80388 RepID=A0A8K0WLZ9_9HYPO|nr:Glucanosyltransferase-domain-containing protein [Stachybotrys elegans]